MAASNILWPRNRRPLSQYIVASSAGLLVGAVLVFAADKASPLMAVVLLVGAVAAAALMRFPYICFLLTVAVVPIERLGRLTDDSSLYTISLMRIMGILALGSFLLYAITRRMRLNFNGAFILYSIYWILGLITITYTTDHLGSVRASGAMLGNLLFLFLVINMVRDWKTAKSAIQVWLTVTVLIGIYTIYNWHFGGQVQDGDIGVTGQRFSVVHADTSEWGNLSTVKRALGPTSHAAVYAINLVLTVPFFFYFLRLKASPLFRATVASGLIVVLYNILLANTRAAILLTIFVLVLSFARRMYTVKPVTIAVFLLAGVAMLPLLPASIYERVLDPSNYSYERSGTLQARLDYWRAGLQIAQENWLTGVGVGNQVEVPKRVNAVTSETASVHNEYLETFIELGIIGWLVFFAFVVVMYRYSLKAAAFFRSNRQYQEQYWFLVAAQISMISVLIYGVQVDVFHFPLKGWWLVAGISAAMYRLARESAHRAPSSLGAREETA